MQRRRASSGGGPLGLLDVDGDSPLHLAEVRVQRGLVLLGRVQRGPGFAGGRGGLGLFVAKKALLVGQFDPVVAQVRDGRTDVPLGELAVDVGGADFRGVGREERVVARR